MRSFQKFIIFQFIIINMLIYYCNCNKNINLKMSFKSNDGGSGGIRLNKCISSLSRRAADDAIAEGRVTVNGKVAETGCKVKKGDIIKLDGKLQKWEALQLLAKSLQPSKVLEERSFVYLKYWKPFGVTCTSDMKDDSNIIKAGSFNLFPQRIFTVGRLDKDSTGLILLTSDGRVNNAMLRPDSNKEKTYIVELDKTPSDQQIKQLVEGVVITTISQREKSKPITAKTRPCKVNRIGDSQSKKLEFILTEGRNRQIRKMVEAIGCNVITLHRTSFAGITLKGLSSGNWLELNEKEMECILKSLKSVNLQNAIEDMDDE